MNELIKTLSVVMRKPLIRTTRSPGTGNGSLIISFSGLFSSVCFHILPYYSALINTRLRSPHAAPGECAPLWHSDQFCKFPQTQREPLTERSSPGLIIRPRWRGITVDCNRASAAVSPFIFTSCTLWKSCFAPLFAFH